MKTLHIEAGALPSAAGREKADVYFALARDSGTSDVLRGENQGRRLHHVAIVTSVQQLGDVSDKTPFAKDVLLGEKRDLQNGRIIVFVQEAGNERVWGAAMLRVHNSIDFGYPTRAEIGAVRPAGAIAASR